MKFVLIIIFLGAICTKAFPQTCSKDGGSSLSVGATSTAEYWKGIAGAEYITDVTTDSHEEFVQGNSTVFVMYYTIRCPYAKQSRNGFAGAAKKMNGKVAFGAVDCDEKDACNNDEHPIRGIPTFYLYKDGEWNDQYKYERSTKAFVSYLNRKL